MNYKSKLLKPQYSAALSDIVVVTAINYVYTRIQYWETWLEFHSARKPPPGAFKIAVNRLTNYSNPPET